MPRDLVVTGEGTPEEHQEMAQLQVKVMYEKAAEVRKKIPNFTYSCDGPNFYLGMTIGNPEKSRLELQYTEPFVRKPNLTTSELRCRELIHEYVHGAFKTDAKWAVKPFEIIEDETFRVHEVQK